MENYLTKFKHIFSGLMTVIIQCMISWGCTIAMINGYLLLSGLQKQGYHYFGKLPDFYFDKTKELCFAVILIIIFILYIRFINREIDLKKEVMNLKKTAGFPLGFAIGFAFVGIVIAIWLATDMIDFTGIGYLSIPTAVLTLGYYIVFGLAIGLICYVFLQNHLLKKFSKCMSFLMVGFVYVGFQYKIFPDSIYPKVDTLDLSYSGMSVITLCIMAVNLLLLSFVFSFLYFRFHNIWLVTGLFAGWEFTHSYVCSFDIWDGLDKEGLFHYSTSMAKTIDWFFEPIYFQCFLGAMRRIPTGLVITFLLFFVLIILYYFYLLEMDKKSNH